MLEYSWTDITQAKEPLLKGVSLTIGVFDGLHMGHRALITRVVENPGRYTPVVVSFRENPLKILRPEAYSGDILTPAQKKARLEALGVGAVVLIDFSFNFSRISAKIFFELITAAFTIKEMVVGDNFRFGYKKSADIRVLEDFAAAAGIRLEIIRPVIFKERIVSSTRIREAISRGMFEEVGEMLGHDYVVQIPETGHEDRRGDAVVIDNSGFTQILPQSGTYMCVFNPHSQNECEGAVKISDTEILCKAKAEVPLKTFRFRATNIRLKEGVTDGTHKRQKE